MTKLCRQTGLLKQGEKYAMDYDGHIIENNKLDNAATYKYSEGYYPVLCSINKLPVYLQNRNGNTPESYNQKNSIAYYIRAEQNENLRIALEDETEWRPAVLNHCKIDVCSMEEPVFGQKTSRRIVAYRRKLSNEQATIFDNNGYRYSAIGTSDTQATPIEVIEFYNQRGCRGEHHFKELDYDFSWNRLPFNNFQLNTIYLYTTAIAYILFQYVKQQYAGVLDFVNKSMRLKNFILHFVTLTARWIRTGRQWILKIFTTKNCEPAFQT